MIDMLIALVCATLIWLLADHEGWIRTAAIVGGLGWIIYVLIQVVRYLIGKRGAPSP
jgi:hypothetical protein